MLLELVMIVKNSGDNIIPMLNSVKNFIEHWTILDTGSTDNTMKNIEKTMQNIPGNIYDGAKLYSDPFVDFSTARNRALELAGDRCTFALVLNDTDKLLDDPKSILLSENSPKDGYYITICDDDKTYTDLRIIKTSSKSRYIHKIKEKLVCNTTGKLPIIVQAVSYQSTDIKSDIRLLRRELESYPDDTRLAFYLGEALLNTDKEEALKTFSDVIKKSKKDVYDLSARISTLMSADNMETVFSMLSRTCKKYPNNPTVLYLRALYYRQLDSIDKAYKWIQKAAAIENPYGMTYNYIQRFELPYLFTDICIAMGNMEAAEKVIKTYLPKYRDTRLLNIVYQISNVPQTGQRLETPIIVFHSSEQVLWTPDKFNNANQQLVTGLAKSLAKIGFRVFVFGKFNESITGVHKGVQYMDSVFYQQFLSTYIVNILIVCNDTRNLIYHANVKKAFFWVTEELPYNSQAKKLLSIQYHPKKFKKIISMSKAHKQQLTNKLNIDSRNISITNYAYDETLYSRQYKKKPYRFIYTSLNGLNHLLDVIEEIHDVCNETTLYLFVDNIPDKLMRRIEKLSYIFTSPSVSIQQCAYEYSISSVWLCPLLDNNARLSLLNAQAACCKCIIKTDEVIDNCITNNNLEDLVEDVVNYLTVGKEVKYNLTNNFNKMAEDWKDKLFCL
jgi:tetratricopeptide (TPR) repeat protein